jgi:nicotinate phosphoribosyltransferase
MGGFDGTSNVKAGLEFDINISGTHAHSYVSSFTSLKDLHSTTIERADTGAAVEFASLVVEFRAKLEASNSNEGELAAFISYAQANPRGFLALIDTYDTLTSGLMNFLAVALALHRVGYTAKGVRLDSGDLAYLSKECRRRFVEVSARFGVPFERLTIVASNDLSEQVILALNEQKHEIDCFGIGTHLVTCKAQPALGCVYKLVEINGHPRIKLSEDISKVTIPCRKNCFRLYNSAGMPLLDVLVPSTDPEPKPGERMLCHHPFDANKRVFVTPARVESLLQLWWDGRPAQRLPSLHEIREHVKEQVRSLRPDHLRALNPTPYKLSLSERLYRFMHQLWLDETPIKELS